MKLSSRTALISLAPFAAFVIAGCGAATEPTDSQAGASTETAEIAAPASAPGAGAAAPHGDKPCFHGMGDETVTLADLPERVRERLAKADANGDGVVTKDERAAARSAFMADFKAKADTNHDGNVSDDERRAAFTAGAEARFAEHDKNVDGQLTADEVGPEHWSRISKADANGDGSVTRDELKTAFQAGKLGFRHHHGFRRGAGPSSSPAADPSEETTL